MSSLSQRLSRLRESGNLPRSAARDEKENPAKSSDRSAVLRARRITGRDAVPESASITDSSSASVSITAESRPPGEGWECRSDFFWERIVRYPTPLPEAFPSGFILPAVSRAEDLVFYDLETTGLSGGAGNTAFLIGLGCLLDSVFTVHQLFLSDYPGEAAMLKRYGELVGVESPQVSYNGRSFDSQVLRTRFLLNRMPPIFPPQADLLYPSRRLWRGVLPDLTLRTLETRVLDYHRIDDLPGSEAPDAWFEWLGGRPGRIEGVFRHNADDIVSLARLLARLEEWGNTEPATGGMPPAGARPSSWGMAAQWSQRDPVLERQWLESGWIHGERRCGMELAARHRRDGFMDEAREIWEQQNAGMMDYSAAVELAKFWEHREKNPGRALELIAPLFQLPLSERHRRELEHRRRRLLRKSDGAS